MHKIKNHKDYIDYSIFCPFCNNLFGLSNELFDFPMQEKTRIHCPNCGLDFYFNPKKDKIFQKTY